MKLDLKPIVLNEICTISEMYMNDIFFCHTLEDTVRLGLKIKNETAIPSGVYEIKLTYSPKFKKNMPEIVNVPNFTGIRIHSGNQSSDTSGCILVGKYDTGNKIIESKKTFEKLYSLINEAISLKQKIIISINR